MRILVIDDDPGVRILCTIAFRTDGDEVIPAASGREGQELLATEDVDAVILDVVLPNSSGFEILRGIREDPRTSHLPVVLLSVRVGVEDQIEGWRAGADDYLTKPFYPSALAARVAELTAMDPEDRASQRTAHLREHATA